MSKCSIFRKPIAKGLPLANHMAMHQREIDKAEIYGWSDRNPFRANRPLTQQQRHRALESLTKQEPR